VENARSSTLYIDFDFFVEKTENADMAMVVSFKSETIFKYLSYHMYAAFSFKVKIRPLKLFPSYLLGNQK
jgi:hypothetical protein